LGLLVPHHDNEIMRGPFPQSKSKARAVPTLKHQGY